MGNTTLICGAELRLCCVYSLNNTPIPFCVYSENAVRYVLYVPCINNAIAQSAAGYGKSTNGVIDNLNTTPWLQISARPPARNSSSQPRRGGQPLRIVGVQRVGATTQLARHHVQRLRKLVVTTIKSFTAVVAFTEL